MSVPSSADAEEAYALERFTPSRPSVEVKNPVDVWALVPRLRARFRRRAPHGYRGGKRKIRDALRRTMHIGPSRAAYLVDRMEAEGAIVYREGERSTQKSWRFRSREDEERARAERASD